mmetsp:Transcript_5113/g.16356  ORF Transcript_5113/g.16356 Transcript_5113/m.16356 type:complete len:110 (-) Transcript_5113:19-348(-)
MKSSLSLWKRKRFFLKKKQRNNAEDDKTFKISPPLSTRIRRREHIHHGYRISRAHYREDKKIYSKMVIRTKEEHNTQNPGERENKAMIKKEQIFKNDSHRRNALIAAHQ